MLKYLFNHKTDHYYGHPLAPLELIEYGDFQCEYCGDVFKEIKLLQEKMGNQLKFVFRHYPFSTIHPIALDAAVASEAAASNSELSFWQMHDIIFENQKYLTRSSLSKFADEVGLDVLSFQDNRNHKKLVQKVLCDFESGVKSGVHPTPTFFINGHMYNDFHDFESFYKTCTHPLSVSSMAA
jgi:protein-disulfide isomerase